MPNREHQSKPEEQEKTPTQELDSRIKSAGMFLATIDQAVTELQIDEETGKITYQPQTIKIEDSSQQWFAQQHVKITQEYQARQTEALTELRQTPGVLDVQIVGGAVVLTFDSSKQAIELSLGDELYKGDEKSDRGSYKNANDRFLGVVFVDINKDKRDDGVSATISAQHELHHHNLAMVDYVLSQDHAVNMASAVRKIGNSALFGKGVKEAVKHGFIARDTLKKDAEEYTALLGREYTDDEKDNIELQLRYLDELHSSYLQKKPNWFSTQQNVYSTRGKGKHWEIVGSNEADQTATRDMLGYLQATYIMDTDIISTVKKQVEAYPDKAPDYIKEMIVEWQNVFAQIGGVIGTARTVQQAQRLVAEQWTTFKSKHVKFFEKNQMVFEQLVASWEERDVQAGNLRSLFTLQK